jgi:hypothetical protein
MAEARRLYGVMSQIVELSDEIVQDAYLTAAIAKRSPRSKLSSGHNWDAQLSP